ncbi:Uncharacterized protein GBIM_14078 [Gryllus bimaculatus]|nr:Uncharacterized protein GBIM_14078 [Gryllus bimaculatus]
MYPEYHKVHQMMRDGGAGYPQYSALPETHLLALRPGHAWLSGPKSRFSKSSEHLSSADNSCAESETSINDGDWYSVSATAVLVGARPDLRYLKLPSGETNLLAIDPSRPVDPKTNPIDVDPVSYRVLNAPKGLYALGPLAGDTFVRFVLGGAVGVAAHIQKQR